MTRFEPGQTYTTRSIGDNDCIISVTITRRTDKTVWGELNGKPARYRVHTFEGREYINPWGHYSMAPVLWAK